MLDVMQNEIAQRPNDIGGSRRPRRGRHDSGFTLIELVIVVAIIGVALAVSIPNLLRSKIRADMLSQVKMTQQAFAVSRINAIQGRAPVSLELTDQGTFYEWTAWKDVGAQPEVFEAGEPEVGSWMIPKGRFVVAQDPAPAFRLYRLGGSATRRGVVFFPNGNGIVNEAGGLGVGQGGVRFTDKKGNQFRLRVQGGTGTVIREMWDPDNGVWDDNSTKYWRY